MVLCNKASTLYLSLVDEALSWLVKIVIRVCYLQ